MWCYDYLLPWGCSNWSKNRLAASPPANPVKELFDPMTR